MVLISLFFSDLYGRMRTHADSRMVAEVRCQQSLTPDGNPTATAALREFLGQLTKVTITPEDGLGGHFPKRKRKRRDDV